MDGKAENDLGGRIEADDFFESRDAVHNAKASTLNGMNAFVCLMC